MSNRISVIIDVVADQASKRLGGFRQSLADTEGAAGKMKVGLAGAFDFAKANAAEFALAAGAALVGFGIKSVDAFQTTALEAGELRDKLGLTADEASRFIEVAGDMGIEVGDLEATIGRMNREADNSPAKFDAIGAAIVRNKDGTINVKDTFLATVDALNRMPDAAKRAKAGQEIFGRSWMGIAEMVGQGAEGMQLALDSVEVGKVISDQEIDDARDYRDSIDALKGVFEELTVEVGGALVPVLTDAATAMMEVKTVADDLGAIIPGPVRDGFRLLGDQVQRSLFWPKYLLDFKGALTDTQETTGSLGASITEFSDDAESDLGGLADAYIDNAKGMQRESQRTADKLTADWDRILGKINEEQAFRDASAEFGELRDAAFKAFTEGGAAVDEYRGKQLEAQAALSSYIMELGDIPPEKATEINALIDQGKIDEAERQLEFLTRRRQMLISPVVTGSYGGGYTAKGGIDGNPATPYHTGGMVGGGKFSSDEVPAVLKKGEMVLTEGQQASVANAIGGGGITINVTADTFTNGNDVGKRIASELEAYYRRGGRRL